MKDLNKDFKYLYESYLLLNYNLLQKKINFWNKSFKELYQFEPKYKSFIRTRSNFLTSLNKYNYFSKIIQFTKIPSFAHRIQYFKSDIKIKQIYEKNEFKILICLWE